MATQKSTSKPALPEPTKTEVSFALLGDHLAHTSESLQGLADLLYHNQDRFKNDPLISGIENILTAISDDLADTAHRLKGGVQ